jgi:hypothetical protein
MRQSRSARFSTTTRLSHSGHTPRKQLLNRHPDPDDDTIKHWRSGNPLIVSSWRDAGLTRQRGPFGNLGSQISHELGRAAADDIGPLRA